MTKFIPNQASQTQLIVLAAFFLVITGNMSFFGKVTAVYPWSLDNAGFLTSLAIAHASVLVLLMALLSCLVPVRIVVSLFVLLAAAIGFFADQYGVVIDTVMIQNVLETDSNEAGDLLNSGLFFRLLLLGLVPLALVWWLPLQAARRSRQLVKNGKTIIGAISVLLVCVLGFSNHYASFLRVHKPLRYYANPTYALYSAAKFSAESGPDHDSAELAGILPDAHIEPADTGRELIIMVVGETARRDRFSLNGYSRITNPELAQETQLVSYSNIAACGTSTAVSLPCMFALADRDQFNPNNHKNTENVLDVLQRAGVSVLWRDNNSGSKGVAARVPYEDFSQPELNPICDVECRDPGMLHELQEYIDSQTSDILIVLHQMGNHGPAYFKRYPQQFERFNPVCRTDELGACTDEEIGNAYDNAILYTDHFLAQVIALLKANTPQFESAMLYVSDHGESLGEKGLYLHGMPYLFAPSEQTDVPVIVWVGDSSDIELKSALDVKHEANSHDAVFHSLLSAFEINEDAIDHSQTLFALREEE